VIHAPPLGIRAPGAVELARHCAQDAGFPGGLQSDFRGLRGDVRICELVGMAAGLPVARSCRERAEPALGKRGPHGMHELTDTPRSEVASRRCPPHAVIVGKRHGREPTTDAEIAEAEVLAEVPKAYRTGGGAISVDDHAEMISKREVYLGGSKDFDEKTGKYRSGRGDVYLGGSKDFDERTGERKTVPLPAEEKFQKDGLGAMTDVEVESYLKKIRYAMESGRQDPAGTDVEFLNELRKTGYAGEDDGDPIFQWYEKQSARRARNRAAEASVLVNRDSPEWAAAEQAVRRGKAEVRERAAAG
jgi:hypothetical protein